MKSSFACVLLCFASIGFCQDSQFQGSGSTSRSTNYIDLETCQVKLLADIEVPALESGKLIDILVKKGAQVQKNSHIAQMDDKRSQRALDEATLRHQIARDRASDGTEIETAKKRYKLAYLEHTKMNKLRRSGSMSEQQADRAKVSAEIAKLEHQAAIKAQKVAGAEAAAEMVTVQASSDSIERHAIMSPIGGVVYEVLKDAGEWVTAGETVMKIAQMDRMEIAGIVDGNNIDPHEIENKKVTATLEMAGGNQVQFDGRIVHVDIKKRQGNNFLVFAEVENRLVNVNNSRRWLLLDGNNVQMRIHLNDTPVASVGARTGGMKK